MAQRRMINKDDAENPTFASLTMRQRYLFCCLMLYSDDDGIICVRLVKPKIFPFDLDITVDDVFADIKVLEENGFVITYEKDEYLQVCDWWSRQAIDIKLYKPTKSPLPPSYKPRPPDLKKYHHNNQKMDSSRRVLEQNRGDERSKEKINLEENYTHDYDLPFK